MWQTVRQFAEHGTSPFLREGSWPPIERVFPILLLLAACLFAPPIQAADNAPGPRIAGIQIGFDGTYKVGHWTPVWIDVDAGAAPIHGRLEILVSDGDGVQTRNGMSTELEIPADTTTSIQRIIKPGRVRNRLTVRLVVDGRTLCEREFSTGEIPKPLLANQNLILTYGPAIGVKESIPRTSGNGPLRTVSCRLEEATQLPDHWTGFEGVSALILTTHAIQPLEDLKPIQWDAILQWLEMGGRVVLCAGVHSEQLTNSDSPLHRLGPLVPGPLVEVTRLRDVSALETYSGTSHRLGSAPGSEIHMPLLKSPRGTVILGDMGPTGYRTMIVRTAYGFGQVVFVAFDLDASPFAEWEGRSRIVSQILKSSMASSGDEGAGTTNGRVVHLGYEDLAGQLRNALDQFPGVSLIAFSLIAILAVAYILLIGPGDFFFLKQVLGRMRATWITFPLIVLAFVAATFLLNDRFKGGQLHTNQIDLVDVDTCGGLVRGTTWAHVLSPETRAYDFEIRPTYTNPVAGESGSLCSWQGLPGTGLGGLNTTTRVASFTAPYSLVRRQNQTMAMLDTPIQVSSTKSLLGRWWARIPSPENTTDFKSITGGLLSGSVINPLDVELQDCMVIYGNWAYRLERTSGKLIPGQTTRVEAERPINLEWRLMRRSVRGTNEPAVPWNTTDQDIPRIMEILMFHKAAGGANYTRLGNHYHGYLDLSDHLTSGRAILFARSQTPASELVIDDGETANPRNQLWTFYRIVFPVNETPSATKDHDRD